jgi:hypothetical protein
MYLNPETALIVRNKVSHKHKLVAGPCRYTVKWWETIESVVNLAGDQPYYVYNGVTLQDGINVTLQIQVFYQPDLTRFRSGALFKLSPLIKSRWQIPIREYGNYVVRRGAIKLTWRELLDDRTQRALEREWAETIDRMGESLGFNVSEVRLIQLSFPTEVQQMIEKEAKLQIIKGLVDEKTYQQIVQQEFSHGVGMGWPMYGSANIIS